MAGSISNFAASFKTDLARPSRFDVQIPVPLPLIPFRNTSRNLSFRCEIAQLPSRTMATAEQKFGANPIEKFPYHSTYNELDLTFIVSDDMSEKIFFDSWLEYINPTYSFDFKYKSDYSTTIVINQYDVIGNKTYSINLVEAYPIAVNQLDLDWSSTEHHKLTVVFAYTYWQNNSIQALGTSLLQTAISRITAGFGGLGVPNPLPDTPLSAVVPSEYNAPTVTIGSGTDTQVVNDAYLVDKDGYSASSGGMG
jgi:hypothetical protein